MNQPFDDDMNVLPPAPTPPNDTTTYSFPSAEGYEQVPEGWKPKAGKELPALRCTHIRDDNTRCKNFGVRGTGFNGTPSMCMWHGGSLPAVKAKAEATLLTAKMRLVENTGMALDTLFELTKAGTADQVRLKASTEILDRAGVKGGIDVNVEVTHNISASDKVQEQLDKMADRINADNAKQDAEELEELVGEEILPDDTEEDE